MERLGYEFAAMLVTLVCISYFASQKFALILPGTYYSSHEETKGDKVYICKFNHSILSETGKITDRFFYKSMFSEDELRCHSKKPLTVFLRKHGFVEKNVLFSQFEFIYFLETTMNEWSIFWISTMVRINLVVNSVLLTEVMPGRLC